MTAPSVDASAGIRSRALSSAIGEKQRLLGPTLLSERSWLHRKPDRFLGDLRHERRIFRRVHAGFRRSCHPRGIAAQLDSDPVLFRRQWQNSNLRARYPIIPFPLPGLQGHLLAFRGRGT